MAQKPATVLLYPPVALTASFLFPIQRYKDIRISYCHMHKVTECKKEKRNCEIVSVFQPTIMFLCSSSVVFCETYRRKNTTMSSRLLTIGNDHSRLL